MSNSSDNQAEPNYLASTLKKKAKSLRWRLVGGPAYAHADKPTRRSPLLLRTASFSDTHSSDSLPKKTEADVLEHNVKELMKALHYLHDVVDKGVANKGVLGLLPKSVTVIVDMVTDLSRDINNSTVNHDTSSMLTSCSRKLHGTVADLLQWSDKVLLDGDSAAVDTRQASDAINAVRQAVEELVSVAKQKMKTKQSLSPASRHTSLTTHHSVNSRNVELSCDDRRVVVNNSGARMNRARSADDILDADNVDVTLPPPKPPLRHIPANLLSVHSMVDDVPPPLPVKQRANSVMSDRCSVSRMYSHDDDKSVRKSSTVSSDDDGLSTVSPRSVSSQRHMTTEFTSSLDSVLSELNEAAAPKKPPLNVRILSYDNSTSCEDAIDGRCVMRLTSRHDLTVAGPQSARRSQTSSDGMSQNHTVSSDGMSEYFVSSGHEMSHAVNSRVSEMTCRVVSSTVSFDRQTAASVPTTTTTCTSTAAPPLPMKLKHTFAYMSVLGQQHDADAGPRFTDMPSSLSLNDLKSHSFSQLSPDTRCNMTTVTPGKYAGTGEFSILTEEFQPVRQHSVDSSLSAGVFLESPGTYQSLWSAQPSADCVWSAQPSAVCVFGSRAAVEPHSGVFVTSQRSVDSALSGGVVVPSCHSCQFVDSDHDVFTPRHMSQTASVDKPAPPLPPKTSVRLSSQCRDRSSKTSNSSSRDTVNSHCAPQSMPVAASVASASSGGMVADSRGVSVNDSLGVSVDDSLGVSVNDSRGVPVDDSRGVSVNDSRGVSVDDSRGVSVNDADDDSATCTLHQLDVSQQLIVKKSGDDGPEIRGGTIDALIVQATTASKGDFLYQEAFLATYRTFVDPSQLIRKLLYRYSQLSTSSDGQKRKLANNTFSLLVRVVSELCTDADEQMLPHLMQLVRQLICDGDLMLARTMRKKVVEKCEYFRQKHETSQHVKLLSSYQLTVKCHRLTEFKSENIAEQLTLLDAELFQKIEIPEVLLWTREQSEERSPNLTKFTEHFNKMSFWCRTRILEQEDLRERERHFMKFIKIMKHLRRLNNFNSYLAILSAVDSAPVRRLEWPKPNVEILTEYCHLIDSSSSFRAYRQALEKTEPPCIPYIGLVLQDLTFVHIGNPDRLPDGCVNFSKCWQMFMILDHMRRFGKCNYELKQNTKIIAFFNNFDDFISEESLWQISETIKPRHSSKR